MADHPNTPTAPTTPPATPPAASPTTPVISPATPATPATPAADREIDLRETPRDRRHVIVFEAYAGLGVGEAILLVNDHEPRHLREEFDSEFAGAFDWDSLGAVAAEREHRVRITKLARTPLPRVVAQTSEILRDAAPDASGSIWQLKPSARDLDSNIIALPPGGEIRRHDGPNLDVLFLILQGAGSLETELNTIQLVEGELIWLPRTAQRRIIAGPEGLRYLTLHHRKPTLSISAAPA